jgi:hypothetical protein
MVIQLAPEIELVLRAEASARGVSVEVIVSDAFRLYQTERSGSSFGEKRVATADRRLELAWTAQPDLSYRGQWVALQGSEVIAHGKNGHAVAACARSKNILSPFLFFVADPDSTPFVGGWLQPMN